MNETANIFVQVIKSTDVVVVGVGLLFILIGIAVGVFKQIWFISGMDAMPKEKWLRFIPIAILMATVINVKTFAQGELVITDTNSGLRLSAINKEFPVLKLLLPNQSDSERGIEIEFPEHVTGVNNRSGQLEHLYHLYLESTANSTNRVLGPVWTINDNTLVYETTLKDNMKMVACAKLDSIGIKFSYTFTNQSDNSYQHLQAITCVQLYSFFADTLLERTYIHTDNGFDIMASETPERLSMPLDEWLPCRYHVSYNWPIPNIKKEKGQDSIMKYYRSIKANYPFIATLSHDRTWVAATFTTQTGNLWTNPERSCHHVDPEISLIRPNEIKTIRLTTFVYEGNLNMIFNYLDEDKKRYVGE